MEADEKWYFTKEQLASTPSRKCGYDADRELSCRQQAANFIQDMGQRLQVKMEGNERWYYTKDQLRNTPSIILGLTEIQELCDRQVAAQVIQDMGASLRVTQLCINTAIVYMHRFYVFHSFTNFHRNAMAAAALFLAAKVEEQPRKLEHVIKVAQMCLHRDLPALDTKSEQYLEQAQDLVMNENVLLQTLGFDVAIDHPHTHVVRCCHLVKASKDLAQTSYFMASNSLHLTTMCLQYKPTVVACFCIHLACKWSNWEIPLSNESKSWFWYVDRSVTQELLEQLTDEFLRIFDKCPSRLKRKISTNQNMSGYMGVNELNQKRLPTPGGVDPQHGVSFQQPIARNRNPTDDNRKKQETGMLPPPHRPLSVPDFKKQPPLHIGSRETGSGYGGYHSLPSTSQASTSHQPASAQFLYPPPPPSASFPGPGSNGPNTRLPNTSIPKHMVRPDAMFPPPTKRPSHTVTTATSRPIKTEMQPPAQPPLKASHSLSHHNMQRNGSNHPSETSAQIPIKSETNVQMKYSLPMDKYSSSHQKSHSKMYESARGNQSGGVNWGNSSEFSNRTVTSDSKFIKTEVKSEKSPSSSYQMQMNIPVSFSSAIKTSPPLPPPPPPPPPQPPPPPPPPPPTVPPPPPAKPPSIFSPDKMTPPLPPSPPRETKPAALSPLLLSPIATNKSRRNRTCSSSSEPELIPVMPKLEEMSGFESLVRGKTAIKLTGNQKVPEPVHKETKEKRKDASVSKTAKNIKSPEVSHNPCPADVIDNKPHTDIQPVQIVDITGSSKREHKKKKKHKEHREHKEHKEKDKDREKKKDKHKEKHREKDKEKDKVKEKEKEKDKHRGDPAPIKITIPKDKINKIIIQEKFHPPATVPDQNACLKIKIPKDKLIKPHVEPGKNPSSLKIKISKDVIASSQSSSKKVSSSGSSSKKRERSSHRSGEDGKHSHSSKHSKVNKTNGNYRLVE